MNGHRHQRQLSGLEVQTWTSRGLNASRAAWKLGLPSFRSMPAERLGSSDQPACAPQRGARPVTNASRAAWKLGHIEKRQHRMNGHRHPGKKDRPNVKKPTTPEELDDILLDVLIDCQKKGRPIEASGEVLESALRLLERGHAERHPGGLPLFIASSEGFKLKGRLGEYTFHIPDVPGAIARLESILENMAERA